MLMQPNKPALVPTPSRFVATYFVPKDSMGAVASVAAGTAAGIIALCVLMVLAALLRVVALRRMRYTYFLTHHKAGASATARLLKMRLSVHGSVFIDSDNLDDLDSLFSMVAHQTQLLVVLCTKEILHRAWCLGEIITAHANEVEVLPVHFPDYFAPEEDFIADVAEHVDMELLTEYGLGQDLARAALRSFVELPGIKMPTALDRGVLEKLLSRISGRLPAVASMSTGKHLTKALVASPGSVLIFDSHSREATASGMILQSLLVSVEQMDPSKMPVSIQDILDVLDEDVPCMASGIAAAMVICTDGCFSEPAFLLGLLWALAQEVPLVFPVVVSEGFRFPTPDFYERLEADVERLCRCAGVDAQPDLLTPYVERLFKKIAVAFNTAASMQMLNVGAQSVARRLKRGAERGGASKEAKSSAVWMGSSSSRAWEIVLWGRSNGVLRGSISTRRLSSQLSKAKSSAASSHADAHSACSKKEEWMALIDAQLSKGVTVSV